MVRLAPGRPEIVDEVTVGRLGVDGKLLLPADSQVVASRRRMIFNGSAVATVVLDGKGKLLAAPQVTVQGLIEDDDVAVDELAAGIERALEGLSPADRRDDDAVKETARLAVRRSLKSTTGKRPVTDVHVVRV
jgi:ribonuclease J